jgi:hypothetical protein
VYHAEKVSKGSWEVEKYLENREAIGPVVSLKETSRKKASHMPSSCK